MTYSIVARCPRSGEYGVGIATYSPNVGVRCPVVVPQRGAASVQAVANPWLLPMVRRLMDSALSAEKIVAELLAADPYPAVAPDPRGRRVRPRACLHRRAQRRPGAATRWATAIRWPATCWPAKVW
jgi:hypothetical protein